MGLFRLGPCLVRHLLPVIWSMWTVAAMAQMPSSALIEAAPVVPGISVQGDWQVACLPQGCRAEPRMSGAPGLGLTVVPEGQGLVMVLRTPLGLLLGEGVAVTVDGRAVGRLAFLTCEADGCVAPVRVEGGVRAALRGGTAMVLTLRRRDGTVLAAEYSLLGFIAATDRLSDPTDSADTD